MSSNLYNYFLHYNEYTKLWAAIPKDKVNKYLSGPMYPHESNSDILFAEDIKLLIQAVEDKRNVFDESEHYARYGWKNQL